MNSSKNSSIIPSEFFLEFLKNSDKKNKMALQFIQNAKSLLSHDFRFDLTYPVCVMFEVTLF